jgi:ABC-type transport system substrate-binding protein
VRTGRTLTFACYAALLASTAEGVRAETPVYQKGWTLHDSIQYIPTMWSFDPVRVFEQTEAVILANVYEGLVRVNAEGEIEPALAESWSVHDDGRVWRFKLRPRVRAHRKAAETGAPVYVDAYDAVHCLKRCIWEGRSVSTFLFEDLVKEGNGKPAIRALNKRIVEIELVRPFPLLERLALPGAWIYPEAILIEAGEDVFAEGSIGTGPYKLSRYVKGDRLELELFRDYWGGRVAEAPETVVVHFLSGGEASLEAFKGGRVDVCDLRYAQRAEGRRLEQEGRASTHAVMTNCLHYLFWDLNVAPFDDVRVRRAINHAIDREKLTEILDGFGEPAFGILSACSPSFRGSTPSPGYGPKFDRKLAGQLIDDYLRERDLTKLALALSVPADDFMPDIGRFVKAELESIPQVEVMLKIEPVHDMVRSIVRGERHFYSWGTAHVAAPGEDLHFLRFSEPGKTSTGTNPGCNGLSNLASETEKAFSVLNPVERKKRVWALEDELMRDGLTVPLVHQRAQILLRKGTTLPMNGYFSRPYHAARRQVR